MSGRVLAASLVIIGIVLAAGAWWRGQLPVFATGGDVAALYRFAADNPQAFAGVECTCGCVKFGHATNRLCYVKAERGDERTFTSHAAT